MNVRSRQDFEKYRDLGDARDYARVFREELDSAPTIAELIDHHHCNECGRMFYDIVLDRGGVCDVCKRASRSKDLAIPAWCRQNRIHPLAVPNITKIASFLELLVTSRVRAMMWVFRNRGLGRCIKSCGAGFLANHFRVLKKVPHLPGRSAFLYNFGADAMKRVKDEGFPLRLRRDVVVGLLRYYASENIYYQEHEMNPYGPFEINEKVMCCLPQDGTIADLQGVVVSNGDSVDPDADTEGTFSHVDLPAEPDGSGAVATDVGLEEWFRVGYDDIQTAAAEGPQLELAEQVLATGARTAAAAGAYLRTLMQVRGGSREALEKLVRKIQEHLRAVQVAPARDCKETKRARKTLRAAASGRTMEELGTALGEGQWGGDVAPAAALLALHMHGVIPLHSELVELAGQGYCAAPPPLPLRGLAEDGDVWNILDNLVPGAPPDAFVMCTPRLSDCCAHFGAAECVVTLQESIRGKPGEGIDLLKLSGQLFRVWGVDAQIDALQGELAAVESPGDGESASFTWERLCAVSAEERQTELDKTCAALERELEGGAGGAGSEDDEADPGEGPRGAGEGPRGAVPPPDFGSEPALDSRPMVNFRSTVGALAMTFPHLFRDAQADLTVPRTVGVGGWKAYMSYLMRYTWRPQAGEEDLGLEDELRHLEFADIAPDAYGVACPARVQFPALFRGDLTDAAQGEWFRCEPEEFSRFASDEAGFSMFVFSLWFREQALAKAHVAIDYDPDLQHESRESLISRVRARDPALLDKVWHFSRSMRDTDSYWHDFYKRVLASCEQWAPHCFTHWVTQSQADTRTAYMGDRLPQGTRYRADRRRGGQVEARPMTQAQRTRHFPAHAAWLYSHYRDVFIDVIVGGFLQCDNFIARDEEQERMVWHLHLLGSDPRAPQKFRDLIRAWERAMALKQDEPHGGLEQLNRDPAVREAAAYYQKSLGAVSCDPDGTIAARRWEGDPCAVREVELHADGYDRAHHMAHVEKCQHHACTEPPGGARRDAPQAKRYCLRADARGNVLCRMRAPWALSGSMSLEVDPKKPSYLKWHPVRTHSRLNCIVQRLEPANLGDGDAFEVTVDGVAAVVRVVHPALEGTYANGDCAATGSTRGVKRYFIKYQSKPEKRRKFDDAVLARVEDRAAALDTPDAVLRCMFIALIRTRYWSENLISSFWIGMLLQHTTEGVRKLHWDGRQVVKRVYGEEPSEQALGARGLKMSFLDLYVKFIDQERREGKQDADLPTPHDVVRGGDIRYLAGTQGAALWWHPQPSAIVVYSPEFADRPKSVRFPAWCRSRHLALTVWGSAERAQWGYTAEDGWAHITKATEEAVDAYYRVLCPADGRPPLKARYPWVVEHELLIDLHQHDGEAESETDSSSDGEEDPGGGIPEPDGAGEDGAEGDRPTGAEFRECREKLAEFDWVAYTRDAYGAEAEVARLETYVWDCKHAAEGDQDDLALRFHERVGLAKLRPKQQKAIGIVLYLADRLLGCGLVLEQGGGPLTGPAPGGRGKPSASIPLRTRSVPSRERKGCRTRRSSRACSRPPGRRGARPAARRSTAGGTSRRRAGAWWALLQRRRRISSRKIWSTRGLCSTMRSRCLGFGLLAHWTRARTTRSPRTTAARAIRSTRTTTGGSAAYPCRRATPRPPWASGSSRSRAFSATSGSSRL